MIYCTIGCHVPLTAFYTLRCKCFTNGLLLKLKFRLLPRSPTKSNIVDDSMLGLHQNYLCSQSLQNAVHSLLFLACGVLLVVCLFSFVNSSFGEFDRSLSLCLCLCRLQFVSQFGFFFSRIRFFSRTLVKSPHFSRELIVL